ncbi:MAG: DUF1566 domain-containing protein [Burkholderiales bacterium]|nr:DUF1566 domain-containing protein [Burkholderiales bacterium]
MKHPFEVVVWLGGLLSANLAQASLVSAGAGLVYDNVANVTWSSDANLFGTMVASNPNLVNQIIAASPTITDSLGVHSVVAGDFNTGGVADWYGALAFAKYLNSIHYLGKNAWMLPTTYDQTCYYSYNCTNSMLGELFYTGLGGVAGQYITTTHNASYNLFANIQNNYYWSGTEYAAIPAYTLSFNTSNGYQTPFNKANGYGLNAYSWAVLPGNAAVPEPAGLALFGIGLVGLMAGRRRPSFG